MSANTVPAMLETRILLDGTPTAPTGTPTPTTYTYTTTTTTPNTATPTPTAPPSGNSSAPASPAAPPALTASQSALADRLKTFLDANPNANGEALIAWAISDLGAQEGGLEGTLSLLQAFGVTPPPAPSFGPAPAPAAAPASAPVAPLPNSQLPGMPQNAPSDFLEGYFAHQTGTIYEKRYTINVRWVSDGQGPTNTNGQETYGFVMEMYETRVTKTSLVYQYVSAAAYLNAVNSLASCRAQLPEAQSKVAEWKRKADAAQALADYHTLLGATAALAAAALTVAANPGAAYMGLAAAVAYCAAFEYTKTANFSRTNQTSWETIAYGIEDKIDDLEEDVDSGTHLPKLPATVHVNTSTDNPLQWFRTTETWNYPAGIDPTNLQGSILASDVSWSLVPQLAKDLGAVE